ncbi:isochorismate synthase [Rhodococcoides kyotonense]|uniref:isochorismate synthase n=1 Tax=Rhodococcoides kyotonense TaxID=398843 RepID=A0A239GFA2_9NOCA|nr:isochorismate synthase [Rhodococcus kyotonensis]SNS67819.1 isochorismate synthase [Rhodococcus kyotonensis]
MRASFILSRHDHSVEAVGVERSFSTLTDAVDAVRSGGSVVGALPFDVSGPLALVEPTELVRTDGPWFSGTALPPLPTVHVGQQLPASDMHVERVRRLVDSLRQGSVQKVVLARALELLADSPIDPLSLLDALVRADPLGNGYSVDLSAAGGRYAGRHLVGASPELLVRRRGRTVSCHPFAGTAARSSDPTTDAAIAERLAASAKDQAEHRFVVDEIRAALEPLCSEVIVPDAPQLSSTPQLWHLSSPITGTLRETATTALDLALVLHPTAAVAGVPRAAAMETIADIEGPRGFYAGAVGWTDHAGDGEWMVAIRCAELAADGLSAVATAGGGIVEASDPDAELAETTAKFRTILSALRAS